MLQISQAGPTWGVAYIFFTKQTSSDDKLNPNNSCSKYHKPDRPEVRLFSFLHNRHRTRLPMTNPNNSCPNITSPTDLGHAFYLFYTTDIQHASSDDKLNPNNSYSKYHKPDRPWVWLLSFLHSRQRFKPRRRSMGCQNKRTCPFSSGHGRTKQHANRCTTARDANN